MAINKIIFTRTAPKKKLEIINSLSQGELLAITYSTILRIIKEAGRGDSNKKRSKFKTLFLEDAGNKWNSKVTNIYNWKNNEVHLSYPSISKETIQTPLYSQGSKASLIIATKSNVWENCMNHSETAMNMMSLLITTGQIGQELSKLF